MAGTPPPPGLDPYDGRPPVACFSCTRLRVQTTELQALQAQLRSEVEALHNENAALQTSIANEQAVAQSWARRVQELQAAPSTQTSEFTSTTTNGGETHPELPPGGVSR